MLCIASYNVQLDCLKRYSDLVQWHSIVCNRWRIYLLRLFLGFICFISEKIESRINQFIKLSKNNKLIYLINTSLFIIVPFNFNINIRLISFLFYKLLIDQLLIFLSFLSLLYIIYYIIIISLLIIYNKSSNTCLTK